MADKRVWFITGAGRGMGIDTAKAALAAGHAAVATGSNTATVTKAVGDADDLLVVEIDITRLASAEAAVQGAVERFGRIDVSSTTPATSLRVSSKSCRRSSSSSSWRRSAVLVRSRCGLEG